MNQSQCDQGKIKYKQLYSDIKPSVMSMIVEAGKDQYNYQKVRLNTKPPKNECTQQLFKEINQMSYDGQNAKSDQNIEVRNKQAQEFQQRQRNLQLNQIILKKENEMDSANRVIHEENKIKIAKSQMDKSQVRKVSQLLVDDYQRKSNESEFKYRVIKKTEMGDIVKQCPLKIEEKWEYKIQCINEKEQSAAQSQSDIKSLFDLM